MTNDLRFPLCRALLMGALLENSEPHRGHAADESARVLREVGASVVADMQRVELDLQAMYDTRADALGFDVLAYAERVGYDISAGDDDMDGAEPTHGHAKIPQSAISLVEELLF